MEKLTHIINYLREFNLISVCFRLVLTVILSGAIGIERERHGKAAGLRTHILVCLGSAMASMTGVYIAHTYGGGTDVSRMAAQVISGIGFLGAGTILVRNKSTITGLTTAACIWATGALGLAIGFGFYEAAVICALFMLLTSGKLGNIDRWLSRRSRELSVHVELADASRLGDTVNAIKALDLHISGVHLATPKSNLPEGIAADMTIGMKKGCPAEKVLDEINSLENVFFAIEI